MNDNTKVYLDDTGAVVVEADGQQIEVSKEAIKSLTIRLCSFLNWKIKPSTSNFQSGFIGVANANHTKAGKVK